MLVALLALFLALGGPAQAKRLIDGADIKQGTVRSKQIKDRTGKNGYGMVARANAGNTPFRFMPQLWAYGGGALDEAEAAPTYKKVLLNNAGSKAALQASYDMYVRDRSVPTSALTNTQTENQDPFIAGQLGMMISHPVEYATMLDRAREIIAVPIPGSQGAQGVLYLDRIAQGTQSPFTEIASVGIVTVKPLA